MSLVDDLTPRQRMIGFYGEMKAWEQAQKYDSETWEKIRSYVWYNVGELNDDIQAYLDKKDELTNKYKIDELFNEENEGS